jgi:hypothetical protein
MPELKSKQATVFEYQDLEKLVQEIYGIDIDILNDMIPDYRRGHYTYHEWTVDGQSELFDIDDDKIVRKWIETDKIKNIDMTDVPGYHNSTAAVGLEHIMNRLFLDGHIPAGRYLMTVDW